MKILLIIPAYNEAENIIRVVEELEINYSQYDYVIVNDGSQDETARLCRKHNFNLIDLPVNLGLSGAVQTGMRYALKNGYDAVIQFDGDEQHSPEYIAALVEEMESAEVDIVMGSRYVTEKRPRSIRMLGSIILETLTKVTTGVTIHDPTAGMRLYSKKIIAKFAQDMNFTPEPDTIVYLLKNGVSISQIQVEMSERTAGESYLSPIRSAKYMLHMIISILFIQNFRKKEPV